MLVPLVHIDHIWGIESWWYVFLTVESGHTSLQLDGSTSNWPFFGWKLRFNCCNPFQGNKLQWLHSHHKLLIMSLSIRTNECEPLVLKVPCKRSSHHQENTFSGTLMDIHLFTWQLLGTLEGCALVQHASHVAWAECQESPCSSGFFFGCFFCCHWNVKIRPPRIIWQTFLDQKLPIQSTNIVT